MLIRVGIIILAEGVRLGSVTESQSPIGTQLPEVPLKAQAKSNYISID